MIKEEIDVLKSIGIVDSCLAKRNYIKENLSMYGENLTLKEIIDQLDYQIDKYNGIVDEYFENKFDYRGLLDRGLAFEAPEL